MLNTQMVTVKHTGYITSNMTSGEGSFSPEEAIQKALVGGVRCFILQIDHMDVTKKDYDKPNRPTLLVRDSAGKLLSKNSGSIAKVAETLAANAFRPEASKNEQPLILYLHVVRAPNKNREPEEYLRYLSLIAKALEPLAPTHLGLTPFGSFHRQKMEGTLLTTPFQNLQGKTIILTNADTSLFRKSSELFDTKFEPKNDLDFWSNMRVYLSSPSDPIGITTIADDTVTPYATILTSKNILTASKAEQSAFSIQSKKRFTIVMPPSIGNPSVSEISMLLNDVGVNIIPLGIDATDDELTKQISKEWDSDTLRQKPAALRMI
jgi:hypothetical protein